MITVQTNNVPYILAYKYVKPIRREYFLGQILGNLLMSRVLVGTNFLLDQIMDRFPFYRHYAMFLLYIFRGFRNCSEMCKTRSNVSR